MSSGAGIAKDDIFGINKHLSCLTVIAGDQLIDIDETQDDVMGEYKNKWETNVKIVSFKSKIWHNRITLT